jgi:hypothetical protein
MEEQDAGGTVLHGSKDCDVNSFELHKDGW